MSEKPRRTSNASGDNRPMYKGNRTEKSRGKKGGYKGKGFKDNRRDGNGYDRNGASGRGDKKFNRNHQSSQRPSTRRQHGSEDTPQEDVRTIGGRAGYRPSKAKAPEIDNDVTGRELDGATNRQLRALEPRNAETVAKHLVMAGRYLDIDPQFALEHAIAASRSAGRIAAVREAVGVTAYVAEEYETALRELRTHRRISGSNEHLALLVDCERALNRLPKALEMLNEAQREDLPTAVRVELAIVESGIYIDQGKKSQAIAVLRIPQLDPKRAYHYSPRLFTAYAAALANAGKKQEAQRWERLAHMAEAALGQGDYAEPESFDIYGESDLLEPEENPATDEQPDSVETADLSEQEEAKTTSENTGVKETEASTDELHGENAPNVADEESEEDSIIDVAEPAENKVKTNQDTLNSVRAQQQTEPQ